MTNYRCERLEFPLPMIDHSKFLVRISFELFNFKEFPFLYWRIFHTHKQQNCSLTRIWFDSQEEEEEEE